MDCIEAVEELKKLGTDKLARIAYSFVKHSYVEGGKFNVPDILEYTFGLSKEEIKAFNLKGDEED